MVHPQLLPRRQVCCAHPRRRKCKKFQRLLYWLPGIRDISNWHLRIGKVEHLHQVLVWSCPVFVEKAVERLLVDPSLWKLDLGVLPVCGIDYGCTADLNRKIWKRLQGKRTKMRYVQNNRPQLFSFRVHKSSNNKFHYSR